MQGFADEGFIRAQDRAIEISALFAAADDQAAFQNAPRRNRGRFKGKHGPNNPNNAIQIHLPAARGGRGGARAAPIPDGLTQVQLLLLRRGSQ